MIGYEDDPGYVDDACNIEYAESIDEPNNINIYNDEGNT